LHENGDKAAVAESRQPGRTRRQTSRVAAESASGPLPCRTDEPL